MENNYIAVSFSDTIEHFGVKGMKWGRRIYDNHKQNLMYKYRKKGLNEEAARERLNKRLRNEKIAAGAIGLAAASFLGNRLKNYAQDEFLGRTFRKGKKISTVTSASDLDKNRPFYGAFKNLDKKKYSGYYAWERQHKRNNVFIDKLTKHKLGLDKDDHVLQLVAKNKLKIAPNRAAKKSFEDLYKKDSSFRKTADEIIKAFNNDGKIKNKYDAFNKGLPSREFDHAAKSAVDKFYKSLKKKGYHGLTDMNDKKYSGYNTKNPTIFFDHKNLESFNKIKITRESMIKDVDKVDNYNRNIMYAKKYLPKLSLAGGIAVAAKSKHNTNVRKADSKYDDNRGFIK